MSYPGEVQAFDGLTLGSGILATVTGVLLADGTDNAKADPEYAERPGGTPEYTQATTPEHRIAVSFKFTTYAGKKAILGMLDYPNSREEKIIRVYQGDPDAPTLCAAAVSVADITQSAGEILVTFTKADATWVKTTGTTLSDYQPGDIRVNADRAIIAWNGGDTRARPTHKLTWMTQRATSSTTEGWKYWRSEVITNNGTQDWHDEPMVLDLGDTAAWVTAAKALSSGNDVRVIIEGEDKPRSLVCFNTKRTFVWFLISLAAGESVEVYVWYGNPDAGTPVDLSTRTGTSQTYCAIDMEGFSGTATSGTTGSLTLTGAGWETDEWKNGFITLTGGTGSTRSRRILSNTSEVITFQRALNTAGDATTTFNLWKAGVFIDGGRITTTGAQTVTDNLHTGKWGVNSLKGATVTFVGGGTATPATMTVASNTADTITFTGSFSVNPTVGDSYTIERIGVWQWMVDPSINNRTHRGVYRINRYYTTPSRSWANGDTPGGWQLATRLPGVDTFAQYRPYDTGSGGGHSANFQPSLRARRKVKQSSRRYANVGNADGLEIYTPFRFQSLYWDWDFKNMSGVGAAYCSVMEPGGQEWADVTINTTTYASLTSVAAQWADLSDYDNPTRIYQGVLPADGVEIPTTATITDEVELRWDTTLLAILDLSTFGGLSSSRYVVGNEVEIYDLSAKIRMGGGGFADLTVPRDEIRIGGTGHKIGIPDTYELWVTTDPTIGRPLFGVYSSTGALEYNAAWAGVIYRIEEDLDGTEVETETMEFAPLPPALNMIQNGRFEEQDVSMWTKNQTVGVTSAVSWKATPTLLGYGSMEIDVTAAPVGAWNITLSHPNLTVIPSRSYDFGFAYYATNIGSALAVNLEVYWNNNVDPLDVAQTLGGAPSAINNWYTDADGNFTGEVLPGYFSVGPSTTRADVDVVISGTGSYVGKVYIDFVTFGVPAISISEPNIGTLVYDAVWQEGYLG